MTNEKINGLLTEAINALKTINFEIVKNVQDSIDNLGTTHLIIVRNSELFSLRGKEYRYKNRASFGVEQVTEANENNYILLSYIQKDKEFYVFDAEYILQNGSKYTQPSKHSVSREWIEVDGSVGVTLTEYLKGNKKPKSIAGNNRQLTSF